MRELQAPLKAKYRDDQASAVLTLRAQGDLADAAIVYKVEIGRALIKAGLHPATLGTGLEACSGDMLLEALVACAGVTLKAVATAIDYRRCEPRRNRRRALAKPGHPGPTRLGQGIAAAVRSASMRSTGS